MVSEPIGKKINEYPGYHELCTLFEWKVSVIEFTAEVVLLSASGVLSPGPLFLANLIYGSKGGYHSGIKIALGHTIVELPLIIILALSIFEYSSFTLTEECLRMIGFDRRDCNNNIFSSTNKQYHKKTRNYCRHPQQA